MKYQTRRHRLKQPSPDCNGAERRQEAQWPYAHPPPACNRCRQYKKKCSKTLPSCKTCVDAGRRCSYFTSERLLSASPEVLHARIQWLTQYIEDKIPGATAGQNVQLKESVSKTGDVGPKGAESPESPVPADMTTQAENAKSYTVSKLGDVEQKQKALAMFWRADEKALPLACLDAYFHHVHRAYPFVDKGRVMQARSVNTNGALVANDANSMMLYLIHAIGRTTLERSGKISRETEKEVKLPYSFILQYCMEHETLDSVQILVLLALYSLFDPHGSRPWTIVGILTRQAMAQGLTLQHLENADLATPSDEMLHRLFWSIYVLDRMVASSVGQPPGLFVPDIQVPLPAVTVDEFASAQRGEVSSMLLVTRHVIQLRRLESKILDAVYLRPRADVRSLTSFDRNAIISELHYKVDNWYSEGCLISRPEAGNVRIHDTMAWLNARYYQLLMMLYYPTPFNQPPRPSSHEHLLDIVQKYIHYSYVLLELRRLPLNYITLARFVPASILLLYFFGHTTAMIFPAKQEAKSCISILQQFPAGWEGAVSLTQIMVELSVLVSMYENRSASCLATLQATSVVGHATQPPFYLRLLSLRERLLHIGSRIMGKANYFQFIEGWDAEPMSTCSPAETSSLTDAAVTRDIAALSSPFNGEMGWHFL